MIHFSRLTKLCVALSLLVIGVGLFFITRFGYKVSIDFTGGTVIKYELASVTHVYKKTLQDTLQRYVSDDKNTEVVEARVEDNVLMMRMKGFNDATEPMLRVRLGKEFSTTLTLQSLETVGPTVGAEAISKTIIAAVLGVGVILAYVLYSFKQVTFAIAAVVALFHDILVVLGMYAVLSYFFGAQLDTLFVTALLTTMSFSIHDTIVIFDKIRELSKRSSADITSLADQAVSATMVRSVNNSLTIIFTLIALMLLGGSTIRYFAAALLIGTITGVYSSPFVATPTVVWLEKRKRGQ
jgi:preprotein translocase subunit SecF